MVQVSEADAEAGEGGAGRSRRRGLKIWRAKDSTGLNEMMTIGSSPPGIREQFKTFDVWRDGAAAHVLYRDKRANGCSITYVWFGPNCTVYRHSHSSDCAYLIVAGQAILGRQVLNPGDGFFVPADAPYAYNAGPEGVEAIEFRPDSAGSFNINLLEDRPARWRQMLANSEANRELWQRTVPSWFPGAKSRPGQRRGAKPVAG